MKSKVQKFGKFLSAMVMPNIGVLIAFGFLAALFIDTGWIPHKGFNSMVGPMLGYIVIGPVMSGILSILSAGISVLVAHGKIHHVYAGGKPGAGTRRSVGLHVLLQG